jgi:hypothetical protein
MNVASVLNGILRSERNGECRCFSVGFEGVCVTVVGGLGSVWRKKINYKCRQKLADGRLRIKVGYACFRCGFLKTLSDRVRLVLSLLRAASSRGPNLRK